MNSNSNHNSTQTVNVSDSTKEGSVDPPLTNNKVLEETRELMKKFLERSLSENAKNSMAFRKPAGYHELKKVGKLAFYQRQQSKPEQGNSEKRSWENRRKSVDPSSVRVTEDWSLHNSLKIEPNNNNFHSSISTEEQHNYRPEIDAQITKGITESSSLNFYEGDSSIMLQLLATQGGCGDGIQSSGSLQAENDDTLTHFRNKSFVEAVHRDSVVSLMEEKAKTSEGIAAKPIESSHAFALPNSESLPVPQVEPSNSSHMPTSCLNEGGTTLSAEMIKDEEKHRNKPSIKELVKKMMGNKKKIKHKKPNEVSKTEETVEDGSRLEESRSAGTRIIHSIDPEFNKYHKHKHPFSPDRSPSPSKKKTPPSTPLLKRAFSHKKASPKTKRHPMQSPGSSSSLTSPENRERLERQKSGSLPMSLRYGLNQQPLSSNSQRRMSENLFPVKPSDKRSKKSPSPDRKQILLDHKHHHKHHHEHHHHHDMRGKKQKPGKLQRFFRMLRKRQASESSTASNRSQSVPSRLNALGQEEVEEVFTDQPGSPQLNPSKISSDQEVDGLHSNVDGRPFHHRGSLSFSAGDLDVLSAPENQKVFDEIADALARLSSKYTSRIRSRSPTPGSRIPTPNSSMTAGDFLQQTKRSISPSRQSSVKTPVRSPGKKFRKHDKNENSAAYNAYLNLSNNQNRAIDTRSNKTEAVMPRPILPRRRVHHAKTGSLDSPHRQQSSRSEFPEFQSRKSVQPDSLPDVVDGVPPTVVITSEEMVITEEESILPDSLDVVDSPGSELTTTVVQETHIDLLLVDASPSTYDYHTRESRPSTSTAGDESKDLEKNPYTAPIDEDELVQLLVDALCKKGDQYAKSVDMHNGNGLTSFFRSYVIRYISAATYERFQNFFQRFWTQCKLLVRTAPTRHPEVFPLVMLFDMTGFIIDLAQDPQAVDRMYNYVSQFITQKLVQGGAGHDWPAILAQLRDTEAELSEEELTRDEVFPQKDPATDDELD